LLDGLCDKGDYKSALEDFADLSDQQELRELSNWRLQRILKYFEVPLIMAELDYWNIDKNSEDCLNPEQITACMLMIWMAGRIRISIDTAAVYDPGVLNSSLLQTWDERLSYFTTEERDALWDQALETAKNYITKSLNTDRETIDNEETDKGSCLPHPEAVAMFYEKRPSLWNLWIGKGITFIRSQEQAAELVPENLDPLHTSRILSLEEANDSLLECKNRFL